MKYVPYAFCLLFFTEVYLQASDHRDNRYYEFAEKIEEKSQRSQESLRSSLQIATEVDEMADDILAELEEQGERIRGIFRSFYKIEVGIEEGKIIAQAMEWRKNHFFFAFLYNPYAKKLRPELSRSLDRYYRSHYRTATPHQQIEESPEGNFCGQNPERDTAASLDRDDQSNEIEERVQQYYDMTDEGLDEVGKVLARIRQKSILLGEEITRQNGDLEDLNSIAEDTTRKLNGVNRRVRGLLY